ncbi:MAG: hypothetical protein KDH20_17825 [Rhodocyclaceae bacterium]|nr:hypothetical protein [Rhodocyclaceae bacterium]
MGIVLWANRLDAGRVVSDQADKIALYRHARKIDRLSRGLSTISFLSTHDTTDAEFNASDVAMPVSMASTDEIMAISGVWVPASDAILMMEALIRHIGQAGVRFGVFRNDAGEVLRELEESLLVARQAEACGGHFNFSVVV